MINAVTHPMKINTWYKKVVAMNVQELVIGDNHVFALQNNDHNITYHTTANSLIREIVLPYSMQLKVGNIHILFHGYNPNKCRGRITFHKNGTISSGFLEKDTFLLIKEQRVLFKGRNMSVWELDDDGIIYFHENGNVRYGTLAQQTIFNTDRYTITISKGGYGCGFHTDGALHVCDIADPVTVMIYGNTIYFRPQRNWEKVSDKALDTREGFEYYYDLNFYPDGTIESGAIAENNEIIINDNRYIPSSKRNVYNWHNCELIYFHPNGMIKSFYLSQDTQIELNGYPLLLPSDSNISFHDNGNIHSCSIKGSGLVKKGDTFTEVIHGEIFFHYNGSIKCGNAVFSETITVNDQKLAIFIGESRFDKHGKLIIRTGHILYDQQLDFKDMHFTLPATSEITVDGEGNLCTCYVREPLCFVGPIYSYVLGESSHGYDHAAYVGFYPNGNISVATIKSGHCIIDGNPIPIIRRIKLHDNGNISSIIIGKETIIGTNIIHTGMQIDFNDNGEIINIE